MSIETRAQAEAAEREWGRRGATPTPTPIPDPTHDPGVVITPVKR